jgi:hypothetical protein
VHPILCQSPYAEDRVVLVAAAAASWGGCEFKRGELVVGEFASIIEWRMCGRAIGFASPRSVWKKNLFLLRTGFRCDDG